MTSAVHRQDHTRHMGTNGLIVLFLAVVFSVGIALSINIRLPSFVKVKPVPEIQYQPHAVERHGADALQIRKCLQDKGGADEIWRSFDKTTFYLWCQLPDGRYGFMAIVQDALDRQCYWPDCYVVGHTFRRYERSRLVGSFDPTRVFSRLCVFPVYKT